MNSHLTSAKSCSWYEKARLRDLGDNDMDGGVTLPRLVASDLEVHHHAEDEQDSDVDMEFGPYGDEIQFLPAEGNEVLDETQPETADNTTFQRATQSRHEVLDDDDDERIIIVDEDAGRILRKETPPSYNQDRDGDALMEEDGQPNPFAPFSSELDWKVAHWAVKDGPGHNALNRLLEIPGVSNLKKISLKAFLILSRLLRSLVFPITTLEVSIKS
jgi:hypothetical protein